MTNNFSVLIKKYSVPALLLFIGLTLLIVGITKNQGMMFKLSAILMFVAGGMSVLFSSGKMKTQILIVFGVLAGIGGVSMLWASGKGVRETLDYQNKVKLCQTTAKQNLQDIRHIQKEYKDQFGVYASNWEDLINFLKDGNVSYVESEGSVPGRRITEAERSFLYGDNRAIDQNMTEIEAYRLSKWKANPNFEEFKGFKRDTIPVSLLKTKFGNTSYLKSREVAGLGRFQPDSLKFIPFTDGKKMWTLETEDSLSTGDAFVPAIKVHGILPFTKEEMFFGSLTTPNSVAGSWEEK